MRFFLSGLHLWICSEMLLVFKQRILRTFKCEVGFIQVDIPGAGRAVPAQPCRC